MAKSLIVFVPYAKTNFFIFWCRIRSMLLSFNSDEEDEKLVVTKWTV